jgi:D-serine deaminase-like pyridoxal phosphate-dependent protein
VGALDNLQASDRIVIEYLESVAIVVAPEGSELPIGDAGVLAASNDEERPALVSAETSVVVATVEAFNAEDRWATLRMEDGTLQSIMVSEDARLDLVKVGDQVRFRVTRAMAISVEEPDS